MGHCAGLPRNGTHPQQSLSPLTGHPKVKKHSIHGRQGNVNQERLQNFVDGVWP